MRATIGFVRGIMRMPALPRAWVTLLAAVNMASVIFIGHLEGQVVFAAMMAGGLIQAAIFSKLGFVRLLGIGHVFWIPMLFWLYTRLDVARAEPAFFYWILAVLVMDGISVIIDVVDIVKYVSGDRQPAATIA